MKRFAFFRGKKPQQTEAAGNPSEQTPEVSDAVGSSAGAEPADAGLPDDTAQEAAPKRRFGFLDAKIRTSDAEASLASAKAPAAGGRHPPRAEETPAPRTRGVLPGSDGEHGLQCKYASEERAEGFYARQVLNHLSPAMQEFVARQEILFVATADRHGECDCTPKFGRPGFIRVLGDKYLMYPEYRGNGVFANLGNITENPHIAMIIIDFYRDTVGLHVNGKARIVENAELLEHRASLPPPAIDEIRQEGKKQPERWVMVEVEEAYIQCSKHIPLMKKLDKRIEWGTDNVVAKGGDYFRLQELSLYERVGGDKAMEQAVDLFYRKVLQDELIGKFFEDVDMEGQRLKQKSFLAMAFGGPYQYTGKEMREAHQRLVDQLGLTDVHFDRVIKYFRESVQELRIPGPEIEKMCEVLESFRDDVLGR